jgi:hypothetical protein
MELLLDDERHKATLRSMENSRCCLHFEVLIRRIRYAKNGSIQSVFTRRLYWPDIPQHKTIIHSLNQSKKRHNRTIRTATLFQKNKNSGSNSTVVVEVELQRKPPVVEGVFLKKAEQSR